MAPSKSWIWNLSILEKSASPAILPFKDFTGGNDCRPAVVLHLPAPFTDITNMFVQETSSV